MKKIKFFLTPLIPRFIWSFLKRRVDKRLLKEWKRKGCPVPPPHLVKQMTIKEYQEKYSLTILVETGTFLGDMVEAQKNNFNKIYSIELGIDLYNNAKRRFKGNNNITLIYGDSGKVLKDILKEVNKSALFWLDGHYSEGITARGDKDCPIFEELRAIFKDNNLDHVLLIDDARLFVGEGDYPTIEELSNYISSINDKYEVEVKYDIIRFVPKIYK